MVFACLGFIFPGVTLLAKWSGAARPGDLASCARFSYETVAMILSALALITVAWPLALRRLDSALFAMAWLLPVVGTLGLWFYLAGLGVAVCRPLPLLDAVSLFMNVFGLSSTAALFWFFFRPQIRRVVETSPKKWDFESMKYSLWAPVSSQSGDRRFGVGKVLAVLGSLVLAQQALEFVLRRYMSLGQAREWEGAMLMMLLGYVALLFAVAQLYTMFVVYKKCSAMGRKMTIREFGQ